MSLSMSGNSDGQRKRQMPMGKRFQKGASGNPSGRPKGLAEFQELCRGHTLKAVQTLVAGLDDPNGHVRMFAADKLLDRGWGKAAEIISASLTINMSVDERMQRIRQLATLLNMQVIDGQAEEVRVIEACPPNETAERTGNE